jgi:hypothetical protein
MRHGGWLRPFLRGWLRCRISQDRSLRAEIETDTIVTARSLGITAPHRPVHEIFGSIERGIENGSDRLLTGGYGHFGAARV